MPAVRRDARLGLFAEYGVTDRLTLQLKADWQKGEDAFVEYEGRGPIEIGATWQLFRDDRNAVSLYGGYGRAGEGRNADYAPPGVGEHDWEARLSAGRSLGPRWGMDRSFVEIQAARRLRDGLPDETRVDATAGARFGGGWMALGQALAGRRTAAPAGCRWRRRWCATWGPGACRPDGDNGRRARDACGAWARHRDLASVLGRISATEISARRVSVGLRCASRISR